MWIVMLRNLSKLNVKSKAALPRVEARVNPRPNKHSAQH